MQRSRSCQCQQSPTCDDFDPLFSPWSEMCHCLLRGNTCFPAPCLQAFQALIKASMQVSLLPSVSSKLAPACCKCGLFRRRSINKSRALWPGHGCCEKTYHVPLHFCPDSSRSTIWTKANSVIEEAVLAALSAAHWCLRWSRILTRTSLMCSGKNVN